jgi:cell division protein ZapE
MSSVARLVDRSPELVPRQLLASMVPPPRFADVSFESYRPDAGEPTQAAAVAGLRAFVERVNESAAERSSAWWRRAPAPPEGRPGVYLDGGFGVGKTHLLASAWHAAREPKVFCTFVEMTHLVGALGFAEAVSALSGSRLLCIDEFELDDPGDTVLVSSLLTKLTEQGVHLAATSNTLPDRLGEDRFAAEDFLREIQALSTRFDVFRIDGEDYRHRGLPPAPPPVSAQQLARAAEAHPDALLDDFDDVLDHLSRVHPSRYGAMLHGVSAVYWRGVHVVDDQAAALRLVVLVDRLYDRGVQVASSGVPLDRVFTPELLSGGYRKKYFRAVSRLVALTRSEPVASSD